MKEIKLWNGVDGVQPGEWLKAYHQVKCDDPTNIKLFPAYCVGYDEDGFVVLSLQETVEGDEPEYLYDAWLKNQKKCFEIITEKEVIDALWWEYDKHKDNF